MVDASWLSFAIGLVFGAAFGLIIRAFGKLSDRRFQRRLAENNQDFLTKLQRVREQLENTHERGTNG